MLEAGFSQTSARSGEAESPRHAHAPVRHLRRLCTIVSTIMRSRSC